MSSNNSEILTRTEHAEAIILRIEQPLLREGEHLSALRDALFREVESADRPVILDLSVVEFLSSAALGWLITLRRGLAERGRSFNPPCRRGLFAVFPDTVAALDAIRRGESDPLLLCGAGPGVQDLFRLC